MEERKTTENVLRIQSNCISIECALFCGNSADSTFRVSDRVRETTKAQPKQNIRIRKFIYKPFYMQTIPHRATASRCILPSAASPHDQLFHYFLSALWQTGKRIQFIVLICSWPADCWVELTFVDMQEDYCVRSSSQHNYSIPVSDSPLFLTYHRPRITFSNSAERHSTLPHSSGSKHVQCDCNNTPVAHCFS